MDNNQQSTQPVEQPSVSPGGAPPTNSTNAEKNPPTPPATPSDQGDVVLQSDGDKKKSKGPIIAIIAIVAALLVGGGVFAAVAMMSASQPDRIILSAANNILNAKSLSTNGTMELTMKDAEASGIKSFKFESTEKMQDQNTTGDFNFSVTLANDAEINLGVGSVVMSDGVFYFKIDGIKKAYEDNVKELLMGEAQIYADTDTESIDVSADSGMSTSPEQALASIDSIIDSIEGKWIRVSIDEVLESELMEAAGLDNSTKQMISSAYKCGFDKISNISQYSNEFADYYTQNPFIVMNKGQGDFYDLTYDEEKLANFINAMPKMKIVSDLASCANYSLPSDTSLDVTASDLGSVKDSLGQISAKFDGLFDHRLTELKVYQDTEVGTVSSDITFNYSGNAPVSAPSDSTPVMDVVTDILMIIGDMPIDESVIDVYEEEVVTDLMQ